MNLKVMYGRVQDDFLIKAQETTSFKIRPIYHTLYSKHICRMIYKEIWPGLMSVDGFVLYNHRNVP